MRTRYWLGLGGLLLTPGVVSGQPALLPVAERHRYPPAQQVSTFPDTLRYLVTSALARLRADPAVERVGGHAPAGCRLATQGAFVTRGQWTVLPDGRPVALEVTAPRALADSGRAALIELVVGPEPDERSTEQGPRLATQLTLSFDAFLNHYTNTTDPDRAPVRWDMYPATDLVAGQLRSAARDALARPCRAS